MRTRTIWACAAAVLGAILYTSRVLAVNANVSSYEIVECQEGSSFWVPCAEGEGQALLRVSDCVILSDEDAAKVAEGDYGFDAAATRLMLLRLTRACGSDCAASSPDWSTLMVQIGALGLSANPMLSEAASTGPSADADKDIVLVYAINRDYVSDTLWAELDEGVRCSLVVSLWPQRVSVDLGTVRPGVMGFE